MDYRFSFIDHNEEYARFLNLRAWGVMMTTLITRFSSRWLTVLRAVFTFLSLSRMDRSAAAATRVAFYRDYGGPTWMGRRHSAWRVAGLLAAAPSRGGGFLRSAVPERLAVSNASLFRRGDIASKCAGVVDTPCERSQFVREGAGEDDYCVATYGADATAKHSAVIRRGSFAVYASFRAGHLLINAAELTP